MRIGAKNPTGQIPFHSQNAVGPDRPTASHDNARSGLGLGLFIVREIAHAHGGEVEVRSDAGETTFAVRLPRHAR